MDLDWPACVGNISGYDAVQHGALPHAACKIIFGAGGDVREFNCDACSLLWCGVFWIVASIFAANGKTIAGHVYSQYDSRAGGSVCIPAASPNV